MYLLIRFLAAEFIWKLKPKQPSTTSPGNNAQARQNPSVHLHVTQLAFFKEELGEGRDGVRNSTYRTRLATQTPILHPQNTGQRTEADACQPHSDRLQHTALRQLFFFTMLLWQRSPSFSNPSFLFICPEYEAPWWVSSLKPSTAPNNSSKTHSSGVLHTGYFTFYAQAQWNFFVSAW